MKLSIRLFRKYLQIRLGGGRTVPDIITMYRNDVEPALFIDFVDYDATTGLETPSDLSAVGTVVTLRTRPLAGGSLVTDGPLTAINASLGKFRYDWLTPDTVTANDYKAELTITVPTGRQRTVKQFELHVLEDLP